ncbi:MAG: hypothetical protein ABFS56_32835 [Pseudomonadota bacterium]
MALLARTIETTGFVNAQHQLLLNESLPIASTHVRVILMLRDEADITEQEWLKAAASNSAFDFLKEPEEDIYTLADGKPFHE